MGMYAKELSVMILNLCCYIPEIWGFQESDPLFQPCCQKLLAVVTFFFIPLLVEISEIQDSLYFLSFSDTRI